MNKGRPKGVKPDFSGVPGELVGLGDLQLVFGRGGRLSPYDSLLRKLAEAPKGQVLKFGSKKARASVAIRAKKLGYRVSFAEHQGSLFVRFDGRVDDDIRKQRRDSIAAALRKHGPLSYIALANKLREGGDDSLNASDVEAIVLQLVKDGSVIRQEGNTWALNPRAKATVAG